MAVLVEMTQNIVVENVLIAQCQDEYPKSCNDLVECYNATKARYDELVDAISAKEMQSKRLADFIRNLKAQDGIIWGFDCGLYGCMVDFVTKASW